MIKLGLKFARMTYHVYDSYWTDLANILNGDSMATITYVGNSLFRFTTQNQHFAGCMRKRQPRGRKLVYYDIHDVYTALVIVTQ